MTENLGKIVQIVSAVTEESSGPTYTVKRLCEALNTEGEHVTLASLDFGPVANPPDYLQLFAMGLGPRKLGRSPALHRWLEREAMQGELGVIHAHGLWMMTNVYPSWVAQKYRIPLVMAPRGTLSAWAMQNGSPLKKLFWPLLQKPALKAATSFHATAESEYEDIRRLGFRQPVAVIPNGVDLPDFQPKQREGSAKTLLFLGRIHPVKGFDWLFPAWARVQTKFPNWQLKIVGSDAGYHNGEGYLEALQRQAQELGLKNLEFAGELKGEAKYRAFRSADLFVLPSHSENFGMAVAEALSVGTPAIVSQGAPWQGLVSNRCGWWVEKGVEPLVEVLNHALAQPEDLLISMGEQGRQWMEQDFAWSGIADKMQQLYRWHREGGTAPEFLRID